MTSLDNLHAIVPLDIPNTLNLNLLFCPENIFVHVCNRLFILEIIPTASSQNVRDPLNLESPNYILLRFISEEILVSSKYTFECFLKLNFTSSTIGSADIRFFASSIPISLAVPSSPAKSPLTSQFFSD